jgi:hypothetical protein
MAQIELQRQHRELTPKFRIRSRILDDSARPGFAILFVMLADGQLEILDAVTITILNTVEIRPWGLPEEDTTEAEAEETLWSGWEFDTFFTGSRDRRAAKAASARQSKPRSFSRPEGKDWYELLLRRTRTPNWGDWTEETWREAWKTFPLRLSLDCHLAGHQPWLVFENVTIEPSNAESKPVETGSHRESSS